MSWPIPEEITECQTFLAISKRVICPSRETELWAVPQLMNGFFVT